MRRTNAKGAPRARRLATYLLLATVVACSGNGSEMIKPSSTDKPESTAFSAPETTSLGQTAASISAGHGEDSGFLLLDRGRDALSWRLILAPPEILHYVAAHEVAHLAEMNPSAAFWAPVERLFGPYKSARHRLRHNGAEPHRPEVGAAAG